MADKYMKMGASDRFFYYTLTGRSTINERILLKFRQDFDLSAMKQAADEALKLIPEFNKRIVIRNGRPEALTGSGDVAFIPYKENASVALGSEETNGLLFYFSYIRKELTLSVFHGLTDAFGMRYYVRTVLYLYLKKKDFVLTAEEEAELTAGLRTAPVSPDLSEQGDRLMPYETWGDICAEPEWHYENPGAFVIPETPYDEECDYIHICRIEAKADEVKKARDETGVSYLPFMADLVSSAVAGSYDCKDRSIVVMSAIDQRKVLGSHTLVNCSDSIFLPYTAELGIKEKNERCAGLRNMMKQQFEPALHKKMAADKVQTVRGFEKLPEGCIAVAKRLELLPSSDNFSPMTYVLTFIGDMSMGSAADRLLDDVMIYNTARANFVIMGYYGDKIHILVGNRNDSCRFAEGIAAEFRSCGIQADIIGDSHFYGDKFQYETIKTVNESEDQL